MANSQSSHLMYSDAFRNGISNQAGGGLKLQTDRRYGLKNSTQRENKWNSPNQQISSAVTAAGGSSTSGNEGSKIFKITNPPQISTIDNNMSYISSCQTNDIQKVVMMLEDTGGSTDHPRHGKMYIITGKTDRDAEPSQQYGLLLARPKQTLITSQKRKTGNSNSEIKPHQTP